MICILICLLTSMTCKAQSIQHGIVMQYNGRETKTSLGGVEILAVNAGSTVSGERGDFALKFKTLKAGDKVKVMRVEKNGYVLFNKEAVDQWHISRSDKPFSIVMCREEKYREIRNNYERISSASYARQLKAEENKLLALKKQNRLTEEKYKEQLTQLRNDYEARLEKLDNYIDRVARIDLSELTEKENAIITLMQNGKVDEALKAYDEMNLEAKLANEIKAVGSLTETVEKLNLSAAQERQAAIQTYEAICRMNDMRYLAGGTENMRKIRESKRNVAFADTTFVKAMLDYTQFLNDQREYTEMSELLDIAENNTDDLWVLNEIYVLKAVLGMVLKDKKMAIHYALKPVNAILNNASLDSTVVAITATSYLVFATSVLIQYEGFKEAENILLQMENNTLLFKLQLPDLPDVFNMTIPRLTYQMLCFSYLYQGKIDKLSEYIRKYEDTVIKQYEENTPDYIYNMSTILVLKGSGLISQGKIDDGLAYANRSIELMESLSEKNPLHYHERLANFYATIVMTHIHNRDYLNAVNTIDKMLNSLGFYTEQISNAIRTSYYPLISYVFGELSLNNKDYSKALKQFEEALNLYEHSDLKYDDRCIRAMAKYGQAKTLLAMGENSMAISAFYEAKQYMEEFYNLYPLLYERYYTEINSHLK